MSDHHPDPYSRHYQAMADAAKERAHQLRQEAINSFWDDTGHQAQRTLRAANRLAHSMLRHARLRLAQRTRIAGCTPAEGSST